MAFIMLVSINHNVVKRQDSTPQALQRKPACCPNVFLLQFSGSGNLIGCDEAVSMSGKGFHTIAIIIAQIIPNLFLGFLLIAVAAVAVFVSYLVSSRTGSDIYGIITCVAVLLPGWAAIFLSMSSLMRWPEKICRDMEERHIIEYLRLCGSIEMEDLHRILNRESRRGRSDYHRLVLDILDKVSGADSREKVETLVALGKSIVSSESAEYLQRALLMEERLKGPEHRDLIPILKLLAHTEECLRITECEALWQRVLALTEKHHGPSHPDIITILKTLSDLSADDGRRESFLRRALAIIAGRDEPADSDIVLRLTDVLIKMNRFDEAEKTAQGALDILRTDDDSSETVPMRLELLERLSAIHLARDSKSRLEEVYRELIKGYLSLGDHRRGGACRIMRSYAELFEETGRHHEAEFERAEALELEKRLEEEEQRYRESAYYY